MANRYYICIDSYILRILLNIYKGKEAGSLLRHSCLLRCLGHLPGERIWCHVHSEQRLMLSVTIARRANMALTDAIGYYILLFAPLLRVSANLPPSLFSSVADIYLFCQSRCITRRFAGKRWDRVWVLMVRQKKAWILGHALSSSAKKSCVGTTGFPTLG